MYVSKDLTSHFASVAVAVAVQLGSHIYKLPHRSDIKESSKTKKHILKSLSSGRSQTNDLLMKGRVLYHCAATVSHEMTRVVVWF